MTKDRYNSFGYFVIIEVDGKVVYVRFADNFKRFAKMKMQEVVEEHKARGLHGIAKMVSGKSGKVWEHIEF